MLTIRLFRVGKKNQPAYKIVVTDKRNAASRGRFVEEVGFYNPLTKQRNLKGDRVKYWMSVGAKPSDTVHNMLVSDKVVEAEKLPNHKKSKKPVEETPAQETPKADLPAGEAGETPEAPAETPAPEAPAEEAKDQAEEKPVEEPKKEEKAPEQAPEGEKEAPVEENKEEQK